MNSAPPCCTSVPNATGITPAPIPVMCSCVCGSFCFDPFDLHNLGGSGCTTRHKCHACQGDCDRDTDCQAGLRCLQRNGLQSIHGCRTGGASDVKGYECVAALHVSARSCAYVCAMTLDGPGAVSATILPAFTTSVAPAARPIRRALPARATATRTQTALRVSSASSATASRMCTAAARHQER